jgi:hypothetical protein
MRNDRWTNSGIMAPDPNNGIYEFERILRDKRLALRREKAAPFGLKGKPGKAIIELSAWFQAVKETIKNTRKIR